MNEYDKLVAAIENYGSTCVSLGAHAIKAADHKDYKDLKDKKREDFLTVLNAIADYRDSLLNKEKKPCN
jgi:hypothetical protein